jgi:probable addiction module antidote protein
MSEVTVPYIDGLLEDLADPEEAAAYLNAALEDGDQEVFLLALRHVAEARGMSQVARKTRLNRESLYRMLSAEGNPQLASLNSLLCGVGLRLAVEVDPQLQVPGAAAVLAEGKASYEKAEAVLQRVLSEIPVLDQHELRQVQQAVQARLAPQGTAQRRRAFYRALRASGLVKQIKAHPASKDEQRQLVQVQGPPISQTIIEERR